MDDDHDNLTRLSQVRAEQARNPRDWTPRDCLEDMIRQIDKGEIRPETLAICYREKIMPGKLANTGYSVAGAPDVHVTLGLLDWVKQRIFYRSLGLGD